MVHLLISFLSLFTGRNWWLRRAADIAEREGDSKTARELRSHAIWRETKGLR